MAKKQATPTQLAVEEACKIGGEAAIKMYVEAEVSAHREKALSAIQGVMTKITTLQNDLEKIKPKKVFVVVDGKNIEQLTYDESQMTAMTKMQASIDKGNQVLDAFMKGDGLDLKPLLSFTGEQQSKEPAKAA